MTLPASYREQRACANCRHVHWAYESPYCTLRAPPVPVVDHEQDFPGRYDALMEWERGRLVRYHFTCDEHEART